MREATYPRRLVMHGAIAALVWAMACPTMADSVLVDFGNSSSYRGADTPSPDVNGNHWNSVWSGAYYGNLVDTSGANSGVALGFSSAAGTDFYNGPSADVQDPAATVYNPAALGDLGVNEAVYDYYVSSTFEIQNLDPNKTYNLAFYGSHKFNAEPTTVYSVYTDNTYSTLVDSASLDVHESGSPWLHNEDTLATIRGLSPQTSNILYVKFEGSAGGDGYLNAMRIQEVPEPTAALMVGVWGLISATRRRKR